MYHAAVMITKVLKALGWISDILQPITNKELVWQQRNDEALGTVKNVLILTCQHISFNILLRKVPDLPPLPDLALEHINASTWEPK